MQLTWWESGILASAARRCFPLRGCPFTRQNFKSSYLNVNPSGASTLSMDTTLAVSTTSITQGNIFLSLRAVPIVVIFYSSYHLPKDAINITCQTGLRFERPGFKLYTPATMQYSFFHHQKKYWSICFGLHTGKDFSTHSLKGRIESLHSPNYHQDSVAWEGRGQYSAHLFGMRAEALIRQNMFEVTPAMVQRLFFDII